MLDADFGDYPMTASNTLPANICLGLGVPHTYLRAIWSDKGVYDQSGRRHFPSRMEDEVLEKAFQKPAMNSARPPVVLACAAGWIFCPASRD